MKINSKLVVIMIGITLFTVLSIGITMLSIARSSIIEISNEYIDALIHDSAGDVADYLEDYMQKLEVASHIFENYNNIVAANRRNLFNIVLESLTVANPEVIGIWCVFEPNVLEGNDRAAIGTRGAAPYGRFAPYYHWANGKVDMVPLDDFTHPSYTLPLKSGNPTVLDPYEYDVGGKTILMTSTCLPITVNNRTVGVIGFDLPLDKIQKISQEQKPFPMPCLWFSVTT